MEALKDLSNRQLARTWSLDCEVECAYAAMILRDLGTVEPRSGGPDKSDHQIVVEEIAYQEARMLTADEDDRSQHEHAAWELRALAGKLHSEGPELRSYNVVFYGRSRGSLGDSEVREEVIVRGHYLGEARDAGWTALLACGAYERGEHYRIVRVDCLPTAGERPTLRPTGLEASE